MATGCLDPENAVDPGLRELRGRDVPHRAVAARARRLPGQAGRDHRHGLVGRPGAAGHRRGGSGGDDLPTRSPGVPAWNRPLTAAEVRERKARYEEYRRLERESGGGNPWFAREQSLFEATPEERLEEFESRYRVGGFFLHSAYSDLFTDAEANEIAAEFVRGKIRERVRPGDGRAALPARVSVRHQANVHRHGLLRGLQPRQRPARQREGTPIERITERGLVVAGRELELDILVFATGFDAMTGALLAVDPRGRGNLALREKWRDGPRSYLGLTMTDFPTSSRSRGPAARPCSAT